jgi:replicative DNA helicase
MDHRAVFQRMASIESRVDLAEFYDMTRLSAPRGELVEETLAGMRKDLGMATTELANMPLVVSTKSSVNPDYLIEESSRLKKQHKIDMVLVDHMQLMSANAGTRGEYEKFTAISRACKQVASDLKLPLLLISQTSRSNASDKRTELECSDLRGSGAIEEDAAVVMLLYHDSEDRTIALEQGRFAKGPVKTWLKVGKNRYGMSGLYMPLWHFKTCTRFDPYAEEE